MSHSGTLRREQTASTERKRRGIIQDAVKLQSARAD